MKTKILAVAIIAILTVTLTLPFLASAKPSEMTLTILELKAYAKPDGTPGKPGSNPPPPPPIDADQNDHYELLGFSWSGTATYKINPTNSYGFSEEDVQTVITTSANAWDSETTYDVFAYEGITSLTSGNLDGVNVVDWGRYRNGVIAVTMIWRYTATGDIAEVDMKLNTRYAWSLTGEPNKMDVQNIVTHEFGHWAGLDDLYNSEDALLTMYGYSGYGVTYQQTLGLGDKLGIQAVYGAGP